MLLNRRNSPGQQELRTWVVAAKRQVIVIITESPRELRLLTHDTCFPHVVLLSIASYRISSHENGVGGLLQMELVLAFRHISPPFQSMPTRVRVVNTSISPGHEPRRLLLPSGPVWAGLGFMLTGLSMSMQLNGVTSSLCIVPGQALLHR